MTIVGKLVELLASFANANVGVGAACPSWRRCTWRPLRMSPSCQWRRSAGGRGRTWSSRPLRAHSLKQNKHIGNYDFSATARQVEFRPFKVPFHWFKSAISLVCSETQMTVQLMRIFLAHPCSPRCWKSAPHWTFGVESTLYQRLRYTVGLWVCRCKFNSPFRYLSSDICRLVFVVRATPSDDKEVFPASALSRNLLTNSLNSRVPL